VPTRQLPREPNLEHLRKQAKALRRAVQAGDTVRLLAELGFDVNAVQRISAAAVNASKPDIGLPPAGGYWLSPPKLRGFIVDRHDLACERREDIRCRGEEDLLPASARQPGSASRSDRGPGCSTLPLLPSHAADANSRDGS
jgi:hypothetical protein